MKFLNNLSVKITIGIVIITTTVLFLISYFAVIKAQEEFNFGIVKFFDGQNVVLVSSLPPQVLTIIEDVKRDFSQKLIYTVVIAGILGATLSILAGIIFSIIITQPLYRLKKGIHNLKKSEYKIKIEPTGEAEFDDVIEEFNSLSEELEYQETLRKDLISDVSHELKTPITSLLGQVQGMRDKVLDISDQRLELIQKEAERLSELVNLLQEYTALRTNIINAKPNDLNLYKTAKHIKDIVKLEATKKKIKININIPENINIKADKLMLERILQNIIDNSIKYSQGTSISIDATSKQIIISDNGVGIPQEHLEKIFERFYRIEKSRNRKTGGMGLGLALVKEMVEAHGWSIQALNNSDENGVRFVISF